jgi:hypothetical protein
MSETLHAQMAAQLGTGDFKDVGPLINLESNPAYGQPAWANLSLQTINQLLNGTPGGSQTVTTPGTPTTAGWYDASGRLVSSDRNYTGHGMGISGGPGGPGGQPNLTWRDSTTPQTSSTINTTATPGLLSIADLVGQKEAALNARALTTQRTSDINDVANLGPAAMAAQNKFDPASANILSTMTDQAQRELQMGTMLDPMQTRTATQGVLANRQGMLGGTGNAGDFALALGLSQYGQQLQQNRRQFAGNVLTARQGFYGNPFQAILGRASTTNPQSYVSQAQGISAGSYNPFNPESQYAANIYGANQQTSMAANAASASATSGLIGGLMSGVGSVFQGAGAKMF